MTKILKILTKLDDSDYEQPTSCTALLFSTSTKAQCYGFVLYQQIQTQKRRLYTITQTGVEHNLS